MLFDKICRLPEYYLTRTEIGILKKITTELFSMLHSDYRIVELGSGSSIKTRIILDALDKTSTVMEYIPIDISDVLKESSQQLLSDYFNLTVTGIIDTYESGLEFLKEYDNKPNLILFLGSSLGNFEPSKASDFLTRINNCMKPSDYFLVGLDLVKEKDVLEKAYNDSQGITAQFNLNVLSRINDELDGDFVLDNYEHHSLFNEDKKRIEMYIRSKIKQTVTIKKAGLVLQIDKGELIHTEYSHKYDVSGIEKMMYDAGFEIERMWSDKNHYYAMVLASKRLGHI